MHHTTCFLANAALCQSGDLACPLDRAEGAPPPEKPHCLPPPWVLDAETTTYAIRAGLGAVLRLSTPDRWILAFFTSANAPMRRMCVWDRAREEVEGAFRVVSYGSDGKHTVGIRGARCPETRERTGRWLLEWKDGSVDAHFTPGAAHPEDVLVEFALDGETHTLRSDDGVTYQHTCVCANKAALHSEFRVAADGTIAPFGRHPMHWDPDSHTLRARTEHDPRVEAMLPERVFARIERQLPHGPAWHSAVASRKRPRAGTPFALTVPDAVHSADAFDQCARGNDFHCMIGDTDGDTRVYAGDTLLARVGADAVDWLLDGAVVHAANPKAGVAARLAPDGRAVVWTTTPAPPVMLTHEKSGDAWVPVEANVSPARRRLRYNVVRRRGADTLIGRAIFGTVVSLETRIGDADFDAAIAAARELLGAPGALLGRLGQSLASLAPPPAPAVDVPEALYKISTECAALRERLAGTRDRIARALPDDEQPDG